MAYGARLESVLGASPQGFESPILRSPDPSVYKGSRLGFFTVAQLVAQLTPISARAKPRFGATRFSADMSPSRRGAAMSHLVLADFGHGTASSETNPTLLRM